MGTRTAGLCASEHRLVTMRGLMALILLISVSGVVGEAAPATAPMNMLAAGGTCPSQSGGPTVRFDTFIMAECPLCAQTIPQLRNLIACTVQCGSTTVNVDFHLNFVGVLQQNGWSSLHGPNEFTGDEIYLCAAKLYPENYKYMDMVVCMEGNTAAIPSNAEACAQQSGFDYGSISACVQSRTYNTLIRSFTLANEQQIQQTPTITMSSNGQSMTVPTGSGADVTQQYLCSVANGQAPPA